MTGHQKLTLLLQRVRRFKNYSYDMKIGSITLVLLALASTTFAKPFNFNSLKNHAGKVLKTVKHIFGAKTERTDGKPWFCHELDCPSFKKIKDIPIDSDTVIEERCYGETDWVRTGMSSSEKKIGFRSMFQKLFDYIQGKNEKDEKIAMTAPVLVTVKELPDNKKAIGMNFFVPPSQATSLPAPKAKDVKIAKQPAMCVYVLSYGGWQMSVNSNLWEQVDRLKSGLKAKGLDNDYDDNAGIFYAGYDSPWRLFNRHNEVMVLKKEEPNVKSKTA